MVLVGGKPERTVARSDQQAEQEKGEEGQSSKRATWSEKRHRRSLSNEGIQRCITFRSASVVKLFISMQKVVRAGNIVVLDEKNPHIRNIRDGTVIKLDVSNGVYTMDMWICFDETGPVFQLAGTVSGQAAFDKLVRPPALSRGVTTGSEKEG